MCLINELLIADTNDMFALICSKLDLSDAKVYSDNLNYLYLDFGSDTVLMSHTDTIPRSNEFQIYENNGIIRAYDSVLGADDRAGIYAIVRLLNSGIKANVLITNFEERGGLGAIQFLKDNLNLIQDQKLIISFDREGLDQFVCYHSCDQDLRAILQTFGFRENQGTYSDCLDVSEATNIHHINLSVGYYLQHTKNEYLNIAALDNWLIPQYKQLIDYIQDDNVFYSAFITQQLEQDDWDWNHEYQPLNFESINYFLASHHDKYK